MNVAVCRLLGLFFLSAALVACEDVVGGGSTEFQLLVTPDSPGNSSVSGSVDVVLSVRLEGSGGFPVEISHGDREITLDLSQPTPEELGTTSVFPGIYQGVTVRFTSVEAVIFEDGPQGEPGAVRVDLGGDGSLSRSYSSPVPARDGERLAVTVDLGAAEWLAAAEGPSEDRVVPAQSFLDALRVTVTPR